MALLLSMTPLVAPSSGTMADERNYEYAGDLIKACDSKGALAVQMCGGFIGATLEIVANNKSYGLAICVPPRTGLAKAVELTRRWIHSHPQEQVHAASVVGASAALDTLIGAKKARADIAAAMLFC